MEETGYKPLATVAAETGIEVSAIRRAVYRYRDSGGAYGLQAVQIGPIWVTTDDWLDAYLRGKRTHKERSGE